MAFLVPVRMLAVYRCSKGSVVGSSRLAIGLGKDRGWLLLAPGDYLCSLMRPIFKREWAPWNGKEEWVWFGWFGVSLE
jgi:hypothetical protein